MIDIDIDPTTEELQIVIVTAAVAFTAGIWAGVWLIPDAALSVPTDVSYSGGGTVRNIAFQPVPTYLPILSVTLIGLAAYGARQLGVEEDDEEQQPVALPATDGGRDE